MTRSSQSSNTQYISRKQALIGILACYILYQKPWSGTGTGISIPVLKINGVRLD
jgi:hypothetical protein